MDVLFEFAQFIHVLGEPAFFHDYFRILYRAYKPSFHSLRLFLQLLRSVYKNVPAPGAFETKQIFHLARRFLKLDPSLSLTRSSEPLLLIPGVQSQ